ncbi:MAG: helix-turn-helix domain-containing protein [Spirochaetaceae bacterium]|nr:helix-turn-helix domain-containing protein [Spirochaetaceae bacterium]
MKERLKQLRKTLDLTQSAFGKKIGVSDVAISHMESGRTALSKQNVRLICLTFGVREEWFRSGAGDMLDQAAVLSAGEKRLLEVFRQLSPTARRMLIEYAEKLAADEREISARAADQAGRGVPAQGIYHSQSSPSRG